MLPKWVKNPYKILNNDSFDEFRYHRHLFKTLKPFQSDQSSNGIVCPLCPQSGINSQEDVLIEYIDGCFGLVRKKSAGANLIPPRHGATMFADQCIVDKYVLEYSKNAQEAPVDCSEFKSGEVNNMLRSKGKNKLFDEKGVFGRVCRHEYPKGFISMKHGERIAYSVFEVERLLGEANIGTDIKVMYDIGCTLSSHLQKNNREDLLTRIDLAVPVFHCYGHKSSCQVSFSPRRKKGFGLTDGEGIERLWSYLRGFSSMTKEMSAGRRTDILTDALMHHARHRLQQFGSSLVANKKKAENLMQSATLQLQELFSNLTISYDADLIKIWITEKQAVLISQGKTKVLPFSWEAKYVQNLFQLEELRYNIATTESDKHDNITDLVRKRKATLKVILATEKSHKLKQRWKFGEPKFNSSALHVENQRRNCVIEKMYTLAVERTFLLSLKRKYADGQAIAAKLSKQITQRTNSIKVAVEKYNAALASWREKVEGMPEPLQFDEVKDPESSTFRDLNGSTSNRDEVPFSVKRAAIDYYHFIERCKEEVTYLDVEILRLVNYHKNEVAKLQKLLCENDGDSCIFVKGFNSVVQKRICEQKNELYHLKFIFDDILPTEVNSSLPSIACTYETVNCTNDFDTNMHDGTEFEDFNAIDSDQDEDNEDTDDLVLVLEDEDDDEEENTFGQV